MPPCVLFLRVAGDPVPVPLSLFMTASLRSGGVGHDCAEGVVVLKVLQEQQLLTAMVLFQYSLRIEEHVSRFVVRQDFLQPGSRRIVT